MDLRLTGEGKEKGGRDPVLLACSSVRSSLPGRRQRHQQGRQSGQGTPVATVCTGGGHRGITWLSGSTYRGSNLGTLRSDQGLQATAAAGFALPPAGVFKLAGSVNTANLDALLGAT